MIIRRTRSTLAAVLLALLAALTVVPGTQGTASHAVGSIDSTVLTAASDGVRVIVTTVSDRASAAVAALVERIGGQVVADLPLIGGLVVDVPEEGRGALESVEGVTGVVDDETVSLQSTSPSEEAPVDGTGPQALGASHVWNKGYDGSGVGIAVVDTGVTEIADLAGRVRPGLDLTPEQNGVDGYGHGTPVAWLAAGDGTASGGEWTGVAPGAHIVPVKIAGADGTTEIARLLVALDWIARYADQYDIDIVNLSLGSTPAAIDVIDGAVQRLWDLGLVVVVAAGNSGPGTLGTPAANTHVITVGSSEGRGTKGVGDDVAASWSSTGVDADGTPKPDVTVPGQSVVVASAPGSWAYDAHPEGHLGNGYQRASGTSFSAAMISGAAALALDMHPDWSPNEVLGQLFEGARTVQGTHAPTPWLPRALRTDDPELANADATPSNVGATAANVDAVMALGPVPPDVLAALVGDLGTAVTYGSGWYGSGWYGSGWYSTTWFGSGWYGSGWYGSGWYGSGWYGSGWYGSGWYGSGWYGSGWYGSGWY